MHKSKKKKVETIVKTEIKTEKEDLQPLTAYLDDRVDLIKQTFSALKPKTILSLAPDFMKKLDISEIEELCLNELLGISTKRLTSIINATECPSDTESSSGSDVENIEECISLEEISSDSDVAPANNRKGIRARKKRKNLDEQKQTEAPKEVSVLELLELQARARAIRSQLALEPVTKIEVDSDDSSNSEAKSSKTQPKRTKKSPPKSSAPKVQSKAKKSSAIANGHCEQKAENTPKPVKLKRNFRKHCQDEESDESENAAPKESKPQTESSTVEKPTPSLSSKEVSPRKEVKKEKSVEKLRSISPDVITILHSPETLCISDSSDDNEDENKKKNPVKNKELEDSNQKSQTPNDLNGQPEVDKEKEKEEPEVNESEIEDGEILDQDEDSQKECLEADGQIENEKDSKEAQTEEDKRGSDKDIDEDENSSKTKEDTAKDVSEHQIDDVISLEHEELDYETRDQLEEEPNRKSKSKTNSPEKNQNSCDGNNSDSKNDEAMDYIELHDDDSSVEGDVRLEALASKSAVRDDQKNDHLSWSSRWLQSSKVSKILMTSKLGNRVRDKIKKSKRIESEQIIDDNSSGSNKDAILVYESKFAEGSTHQYHELGSMSKEK